jgi:hypothetical protein
VEALGQVVLQTPWWVLVLLVFLISRGVVMSRPATVALPRLLIVPAIFLVLGLSRLGVQYRIDAATAGCWIVALATGALVGVALLRHVTIGVSAERNAIMRPGDATVLPIMIAAFLTRYVFAVLSATHPERLAEPAFEFSDIGLSGLVTGLFIGKMLAYLAKYRAARLMSSITPGGLGGIA